MRAMSLMIAVLLATAAFADVESEERRLNELAIDRLLEGEARVARIAARIRVAGADFCGGNVGPVIGVFAIDHRTIDDFYRDVDFVDPFIEVLNERFSLGPEPHVLGVVPDSPAARAGLLAGDVVKTVDTKPVKKRVFLDVLRGRNERVELGVERGGETLQLSVDAPMGCAIPSRFAFGRQINAFAMSWGLLTGIYFYAGFLDFLPGDDELAIVVGHELAHMILGHTGARRTFERFEAEADYLGLYLAARAGYEVSNAPAVWDAMARENPYSFVDWGFYSHPTSAARSVELAAVLAEIEAKRASGAALDPNGDSRSMNRPEVVVGEVDAHQEELRREALDRLRVGQKRIQNVSYRLAVGGRSVCADALGPVLGATVGRQQDFWRGRGRKSDFGEAFGVGDDVTVFGVAEGSPADRAGLVPGDAILEIDGKRIRRSKHVFDRLRDSSEGEPRLQIARGDTRIEVALPREIGCHHGTFVHPSGNPETSYHANKVDLRVATGLLRFAQDDDELAIAIAHQYGHQLLGGMRQPENEPKADALGIRMARAAGFDVTKAPAYWDRYAAAQFWKISGEMDGEFIPHGAVSQRILAVRKALAETDGQRVDAGASAP
jgi:hypothetical protein